MSGGARRALRAVYLPIAARAARAYVAGPELADALRTCRRLSARGVAGTIAFWNDDDDAPREVAEAYRAACLALAGERLDCYLSLKAPALRFDRALLDPILEGTRRAGIRLHFDSLGPDAADATFALIDSARAAHPDLGCTLPGRWRRSLRDVERAVEMGLSVRVVKGQWPDPGGPEPDPREGFLGIIDRLAGRAARVAVATHDPKLAREALRRLRAAGTPCEAELLYGLPDRRAVREAEAAGVAVRVYVPYGHAWLPYALSRTRRDPRILWWLLRDSFGHAASGRTA